MTDRVRYGSPYSASPCDALIAGKCGRSAVDGIAVDSFDAWINSFDSAPDSTFIGKSIAFSCASLVPV